MNDAKLSIELCGVMAVITTKDISEIEKLLTLVKENPADCSCVNAAFQIPTEYISIVPPEDEGDE